MLAERRMRRAGRRPPLTSTAPVIFAAVVLSGCAGLLPTPNQQTVAGVTDVEIAFKEDCRSAAGSDATSLAGCLAQLRWRDGKEAEAMEVAIDLSKGTFAYRRGNTRAFEGQAVRAAVEQAVAAEVGNAAPGTVQAIADAVLEALAP